MMIEQRENIKLNLALMDIIVLMSEGILEAVVILSKLLENSEMVFRLLDLDDMNIRGIQICLGYNNYCNEDIEKFKEAIKSRDPKMVEIINQEGLKGNYKHKAVEGGASFKREFLKK